MANARKFPEDGVGENWTMQFLERHPELQIYCAHALEHSWAQAVNQTTKEAFFKLFKKTMDGDGGDHITPAKLIWVIMPNPVIGTLANMENKSFKC